MLDLGFGFLVNNYLYSQLETSGHPQVGQQITKFSFGKVVLFTSKFDDLLTKLEVSRRFQPAIYTVVDEESESEVQHTQILQENLKQSFPPFQNFYFKIRSEGYLSVYLST